MAAQLIWQDNQAHRKKKRLFTKISLIKGALGTGKWSRKKRKKTGTEMFQTFKINSLNE